MTGSTEIQTRRKRLRFLYETWRSRNLVMGILNVTPDSFSDGGRYDSVQAALDRGLEMVRQGADLLDIGGESSRPGADPVSPELQIMRVQPVIEEIRRYSDVPISVDTRNGTVAGAAFEAGADMINDISAFEETPELPALIAENGGGVILMHMRGSPKTMQEDTDYDDLVGEVFRFLKTKARAAESAGIPHENIWVDPGIGFGKSTEGNVKLLRDLHRFDDLGYPVVVGVSRKSFIGTLLNREIPERLWGTLGSVAYLVSKGVHRIHRVHDVQEVRDVVRIVEILQGESFS